MVKAWLFGMASTVGLFQMQHTVIQPGGEPVGSVLVLAQDSDGFLWMTTFKGQFLRFDGQSLTAPYAAQLKPFENPVTILFGPQGQSDDVWLGHRRNGLTHIAGGKVTHYDGGAIPAGSINMLRRDNRGVIWASSPQGVAQFVDGHWRALPSSLGWAHPHPELITIDASTGDVLVVDADRGAMVSRRGVGRFEPAAFSDVLRADAGMKQGAAWPLPVDLDTTERVASDGTLWLAPLTGIERYSAPGIKERMSYADGLSSTQVYDLLEDHEGDMWLATTRGLDRFRIPHVTPLAFREPVEFPAIASLSDGSVWITTTTHAPWRYANGKLQQVDAVGDGITAIAPLPDGAIVLAGKRGLLRWKQGSLTQLPVPTDFKNIGTRFRQVLADDDGTLWIVAATLGLYRVDGARWIRMNGKDGLPAETPSFVRRLPDGSLGVAYAEAGLYSLKGDTARRLAPPLAGVGAPLDWLVEPQGMWVGGSTGLVLVDARGVHPVRRRDGRPFVAVSGMVRDRGGALWLFHQDGIDRLPPTVAATVVRGESVETMHIEPGEGFGENAAGIIPVSSLSEDARGRIWIAGNTAVASLDPTNIPTNAVRPKVFIDTLVSDQVPQPAHEGSLVPALTHTVRIDYTAPMLRRPERTRFEYQLSGVDDEWQQAGNRRSAYYTRLAPGAYTFRVRAFNEDGLQSATDAVFHFRVAPMWYQSRMVALLAVIMLIGMAWAAYVVRIRVVTRRLRIRADERERIARDLHDTLLQGFQGLVLRFQAIRQHVGNDKAEDMIDRALVRADDVLVEGREKVAALRRSDAENAVPGDVGRALEAIAGERTDLHPATYRVVVGGRPRPLRSAVYENLIALAREAVLNALQHANASIVIAEIVFSRRGLEVRVTDNGKGFDVTKEREGHWGIRGMRERARLMGAEFALRAPDKGGTEVSVRIRRSRAYL